MYIEAKDLSINFGERQILDGVNLTIAKGNRVGLIGANGAGKSTFLKCIMQELEPQSGELNLLNGLQLGYLTQNPKLTPGNTLKEELETVFVETNKWQVKEEELLKKLEDPELDMDQMQDCLNELADIQARLAHLEPGTQEQKIGRMLSGLGFSQDDEERLVEDFSGGWQMRINLAKLLLTEADLLLLDEPTNHLDLNASAWLTEFLVNYPKGMLIVSHDRYFLDRVVNQIALLERGKMEIYHGNYTKYVEEKKIRRENQLNAAIRQEKQLAEQQKFIDRFKAKATKSSQVKSKEKQLAKIEIIEKPQTELKSMHFKFSEVETIGRDIMQLKNLSKSFENKLLYDNINAKLEWDQKNPPRVFILGDNGCGKTTFFKILTERLEPDSGFVSFDNRAKIGYYAQHQLQILDPESTPIEVLEEVMPPTPQKEVRGILGRFLFKKDEVFSKIKSLSGGEKARLAMAKLMVQKPNVLLLDEPTNHLDLASQEAIESALESYEGTIIAISHDRYFINRHATHIWEFFENKLITYDGNYELYQEKRNTLIDKMRAAKEKEAKTAARKAKKGSAETANDSSSNAESEASLSDANLNAENEANASEATKHSYLEHKKIRNRTKELAKLEKSIEHLNSKKSKLELEMAKPDIAKDYQKLAELQGSLDKLTTEIKQTEAAWGELSSLIEA
jgi:ATP-binding cassette subfamily F protein 3